MRKYKNIIISAIVIAALISCSPLNPVNDFFGIHMNLDEESSFQIVSYNDVDGITYKNSINMNPKINAWAEISTKEITVKIVNNSNVNLPLSYTTDQFILITNENEYVLGKGEREDYISKNSISANSSQTFYLELPIDYSNISLSPSQKNLTELTREVIRDYSKSGSSLNISKENVVFVVVKIGSTSILLKKVP